jgi:hypothetical protein
VSTRRTGRDGRPLIDTVMAAYSLGMKPAAFRKWAMRNSVRAVAYRTTGKPGQPPALWDLADLADAVHANSAA